MNTQNGAIADFRLEHDAWGSLVLVDEYGQRHAPVEPVRSFPISAPDRWISICDAEGRELVSIEDAASLTPEVREVLARDLTRREFVPLVRRVVNAPADADQVAWEIETDRGLTRFVLNSGDDVRRLGPHRALIIDAQGIRYLVDDARELDPASRRIIERFL